MALPHPPTTFVGRRREVQRARDLLSAVRLLTLVGPGGCGKTRLALAVAASTQRPAWFADLSLADRPERVGDVALAAAELHEEPGRAAVETLCGWLADAEGILVLDNCEHVLEAAAEVASAVHARAPGVAVLVTSRAPLGLAAETVWTVPGMSLPARGDLGGSDAATLFLERARRRRPDLELDEADAEALGDLLRHLDGLPLAIELAAAREHVLGLHGLRDELAGRLDALAAAARDVPDRHRTMRASIAWSEGLLDEPERALLRRLSAFASSFGLDAAGEVAAGAPLADGAVLDVLGTLVDRSLVAVEHHPAGARYRLLETIRQFAEERLAEAGEASAVHARHAQWCLGFARRVPSRRFQPERVELEEANLHVAIERTLDHDPDTALGIVAGLARWYVQRDRYREGRAACARALAAAGPDADPALRTLAHFGAGCLAAYEADATAVVEAMNAVLEAAEAAGDPVSEGLTHTLWSASLCAIAPAQGADHGRRAIALLSDRGEPGDVTNVIPCLAASLYHLDEHGEALRLALDSIGRARDEANAAGVAHLERAAALSLHHLGEIDRALRHYDRAVAAASDGAPVSRDLTIGLGVPLLVAAGRAEEARDYALERLGSGRVAPLGAWMLTGGLAVAELALGRLDAAAAHAQTVLDSAYIPAHGDAHETLARVALIRRDTASAVREADAIEALLVAPALPRLRARAAYIRGGAALLGGDRRAARSHLHDAVATQLERGLRLHAQDTLEALAAATTDATTAARLLGAAVGDRDRCGAVRTAPLLPWLAGLPEPQAGLTLEQAAALASRGRGPHERAGAGWGDLTPTERAVAERAAAGRTNPEIGAELFMSRHTVKVHLSRAFAKLGVANRTELAALVASDTVSQR